MIPARHRRAAAAAFAALLPVLAACSDEPHGVDVVDAWVRPTPPSTDEASIYLRVENHTAGDVAVLGAESDVCGLLTVHMTTIADDGGTSMGDAGRDVTKVPAGGSLTFAPDGLHLMCYALVAPLVAGESFPITVQFEGASPVTATVVVDDR